MKELRTQLGSIQIGCWQLSGQPQSAQLQTVGWANAWSLQNDGVQYVAENTLSLRFLPTNLRDIGDKQGESYR
jgi:hypothetical protein